MVWDILTSAVRSVTLLCHKQPTDECSLIGGFLLPSFTLTYSQVMSFCRAKHTVLSEDCLVVCSLSNLRLNLTGAVHWRSECYPFKSCNQLLGYPAVPTIKNALHCSGLQTTNKMFSTLIPIAVFMISLWTYHMVIIPHFGLPCRHYSTSQMVGAFCAG